jgi:DNA segregation ATPase FtsK/SpoIIIE, S-DNA-T family
MSDRDFQFSVTEVRNALRCPRVFVLGRSLGRCVTFPVGSSCLGATFHRIVERFATTVTSPNPSLARLPPGSPVDVIARALSLWLLDMLTDELDRDATLATMPGEVDDLAEALRELARYLSQAVAAFESRPALALTALVNAAERQISVLLKDVGAVVSGRIDALFMTSDERLHVVEFKLTDEANDTLDRAQVALYRELLLRQGTEEATATILRFRPFMTQTVLSRDQADTSIKTVLLPLIRNMMTWVESPEQAPAPERTDICTGCPVARECVRRYPARLVARDDPPMAAARPRSGSAMDSLFPQPLRESAPPPRDVAGDTAAEELRLKILDEFRREGINVSAHSAVVGPRLFIIEVVRPRGSVAQLDRAASDVIHRITNEGLALTYERLGGRRQFVVERFDPQVVQLAPMLDKKAEWLRARAGRFIVGCEPTGGIVTADFADPATPHLLIAGQAGSGKSWLLRAIIAGLLHHHGPGAIRFTLMDPKRVTFNNPAFQSAVASHLDGPILYGLDDALPCIERLIEEMEERYRIFEQVNVSDLCEYEMNASQGDQLARRILVIDEFQDLTIDAKVAKRFCAGIQRLGAKARAAGIHVILTTQRPDRNTVPSVIKANLGGKIALRVANAINSRVILDQGGAEGLLGNGDLLADLGHGLVRAQAPVVAV